MNYQEIERKVALECYDIACMVRDGFTTDISDDNWRKHSGAAHVAYAIKEVYQLDSPDSIEDKSNKTIQECRVIGDKI